MFWQNYLSDEIIAGFDRYKYNAVDTNPISNYLSHPFWNWVVKHLIPRWLAPNLMTLLGYLFFLLNVAVMAYYDPHFYASSRDHPDNPPVPDWVWLFCAMCIFLSYTLDGCDGKQARRTGSSTPLGELFDHGLDSSITHVTPVVLYSIFGQGEFGISPIRVYFAIWCVMACFIFSHWEKYNTGVLYLPWGYDIGQLSIILAMTITYFRTYLFWKFAITIPFLNKTLDSGDLAEISLYVGSGMSLPISLYNIYRSYRDQTGKMRSLWEANRPLVCTTILFVSYTVWIWNSKCAVLDNNPRIFLWTVGTSFSYFTVRLIISQMSNTRCEVFHWLLVPIISATCVVVVCDTAQYELFILYGLSGLVTTAWLHMGMCVVWQMADHFQIHVFSLSKPQQNSRKES
ncbi:ethanolaminephosphotransferase 1 isoform X1 [Lingula anatina]|uniref:Ethanolaminephosphotransferase 1 isoform X1 n=2 Tax=Lingula anatina TaxID=7574 RepID=A0A1S3IFR8_LINAN|nr:ethanolaminephosphotransferase 1 isoform X1 [Lingula anatina]|eukprot:XP_013396711.1 ethanolaminephosphotransferase 1 isoform X1 [Lingula anatina]